MSKLFPVLALILALQAGAPAARAADCGAAAAQIAAQYGAEIISVVPQDGACVIKLRIPGKGGQPPRLETVVVPA